MEPNRELHGKVGLMRTVGVYVENYYDRSWTSTPHF